MRSWLFVLCVVACSGSTATQAPRNPRYARGCYGTVCSKEEWITEHQKYMTQWQTECDGGNGESCVYLAYAWKEPAKTKRKVAGEHVEYVDDSYTPDPAKAAELGSKAAGLLADSCAKETPGLEENGLSKDYTATTTCISAESFLEPKAAQAFAQKMCDGSAWKCYVLEAAATKNGDTKTAKDAHKKWAQWACPAAEGGTLDYACKVHRDEATCDAGWSLGDDFDNEALAAAKQACADLGMKLDEGAGGGGCSKDTDCKGDRVCDDGKCVAPK